MVVWSGTVGRVGGSLREVCVFNWREKWGEKKRKQMRIRGMAGWEKRDICVNEWWDDGIGGACGTQKNLCLYLLFYFP